MRLGLKKKKLIFDTTLIYIQSSFIFVHIICDSNMVPSRRCRIDVVRMSGNDKLSKTATLLYRLVDRKKLLPQLCIYGVFVIIVITRSNCSSIAMRENCRTQFNLL